MKKTILLLLLLAIINQLHAQNEPDKDKKPKIQNKSFVLYTDEDLNPLLQFSNARDQNYTMGLGLGFTHPYFKNSLVFKANEYLTGKLLGKSVVSDNGSFKNLSPSLTLNGTAFTPDDLQSYSVINGDRPYAFLLSLSTKEFFLNQDSNTFYSSEFVYGILGLRLGETVQTAIHKLMNDGNTHEPFIPRGWPHQISDGGEPTFLYSLTRQKLISENPEGHNNFYELKWGWQAMAGYYTAANLQLGGRIGLLDNRNWPITFDPLASGNKKRFDETANRGKFELFLFGSVRPSVMLYNEMLNGGFRHSDYTLGFDEVNHFILEWSSGIGITIPGKCLTTNIAWAFNSGRTSELNTSFSRSHQWGGVYLTFNY
jgi:hypothetical protein